MTYTRLLYIAFTLLLTASLLGCDTNSSDSLYDDSRDLRADPSITGVEPASEALAGIGNVTITGTNFSPDPADNLVFFNGVPADVLSASSTQLVVRPPNAPGENAPLKVAVIGAENFAVTAYTLRAAVESYGGFTEIETPVSVAGDDQDNIYVSLRIDGNPEGIVRISPEDGERTQYAPPQSWTYVDMQFGPDGGLYAVRGALWPIYRVPPGGGEAEQWVSIPGFPGIAALDFDAGGNIWAGGNSDELYRVAPDKSITVHPFPGNVTALQVHQGALYVAATRDSASAVWQIPIEGSGELGTPEKYFDLSAQVGSADATAHSLAFAQDGTLYVGTDGEQGIVIVSSNGESEPYYPGLFDPAITSLGWGMNPFLYAVLAPTDEAIAENPDIAPTILKINTQKEGAR